MHLGRKRDHFYSDVPFPASVQNRAVAGGEAARAAGDSAVDAFHMSAGATATLNVDAAGTVRGVGPAGTSSCWTTAGGRGIDGGAAAFCRINASSVIYSRIATHNAIHR